LLRQIARKPLRISVAAFLYPLSAKGAAFIFEAWGNAPGNLGDKNVQR